jgi:amino acid adenylation domain-containing protein
MTNDLSRARNLSPEEKRALLESLLRKEPAGSRVAPLSFSQQRLWFLEALEEMGGTYHIPLRLYLTGALDVAALRRALDRIVARHEVLRTTFGQVDGKPVQRVSAPTPGGFALAGHDVRSAPDPRAALDALVRAEAGARFDLAAGPLIRGTLVRVADDEHALLITVHHIVSDGWSMGVFGRELSTLYEAFSTGAADPLPALPTQYADYAAWQRRLVTGELLERQASFWEQTLAGAPELLELPADHPRPARQDFAGDSVRLELNAELSAALKALSRRNGTTMFMTLLAGWAIVLSRLSGQADVVVGTPTAGRDRKEIEGLIGFFVHTLALRVDLSAVPTVAEVLAQVRTRAVEAQQNQDIPFEQVVERVRPVRSLAYSPLFQVMFAWQNALGEGGLTLPGLQTGAVTKLAQDTAKFDLSLTLWEDDGCITGSLEYATALFERATVERFTGYLRQALAAMAADEHQPVDRLPLLPEAERRLVVEELNATERPYPAGLCVHEMFRAQAARTPDAVALVWRGERLTYAELERRANRISHALRRRGAGPEVRVGICLPRMLDLVPAMLGVLGAGAAYVPLDPAYPRERLGYMLEDAGVTLVITDSTLADRLPEGVAGVLLLDRERNALASEPEDAPRVDVNPENLSHVIFTSGSTGRPKGVMIRHASTVVLLHWLREMITDEERASVLFSTSINFDVSIAEVFGTLSWGGKIVLAENALELATLDEPVVHVSMVPSAAAELLQSGGIPSTVRTLNLGGEALPNALAQGLYALPTVEKVGNLYGPTEDTTYSTYSLVKRGADRVLVGAPVANTRAYVVDAHLQPVPVGAEGELYLAGDGLSRGYASRPAMTAERFVPCPFGAPGGRMYRVMDRVRRRADGEIEYRGRIDFQVKVRGFRIELGEIESRLVEHPEVRAAVVLAREDVPGDTRLVAYVAADETVSVDVLRAHLAERLPAYMVPAAYVRLDALPQTPNGKVDRRALPAPEGEAFGIHGYEAPVGAMEEAVAAIWAEVVGVERVGRGDDFFELGGHSLLAVRVISRVRQALGVEVSLGDLFERSVLADFAHGLQTAARARAMAIEPVDRTGRLPLSFAQQRLWFLEQLGDLGSTYHIPLRLRLRGPLDRDALVRTLDRIVARHEVLRTGIAVVDGEPEQRIVPAEGSRFALVRHDLSAEADPEAALAPLVVQETHAPFALADGPLVRGRLVRMGADDHVLLITMHHVVSDGWSMGVFVRELGALYAAFARGQADPLPALEIQYADFAAWQRRWVEGDVLREQADYWTRTLGGAPELLELPTDRARPRTQDFTGDWMPLQLDAGTTAALKTLGRRHGTTLYMTLLAGWAVVLSRLSGQEDVVIGSPMAGRGRREIEGLIGFFVNTLALRLDVSGSQTVAELLGRARTRALEAQHHQDIPFEQVVELVDPVRSLAHSPLFQVMFTWQNAPGVSGVPLPGLQAERVAAGSSQVQAKYDLSLTLWEAGEEITGGVTFAAALFERATVERWVGYLGRVLREMAADPARRLDRLSVMPESERALVVDRWNRTEAPYPAESCIHERFEAQAARTPDAVALVSASGERVTYGELNRRANRLAHHLRGRGVGPDVRVGLCVERSPAMVAGLLGILKAGGAFVPLDPGYPRERLEYMLADSAPAAVLAQGSVMSNVADTLAALGRDVPVLELDAAAPAWANAPETNPERGALTPGHPAYVTYTSGSTGRPKGVPSIHHKVLNLIHWYGREFGITERDSVLLVMSFSFDGTYRNLFAPLFAGGELHLAGEPFDPAGIVAQIAAGGICLVNCTPSAFQAIAEADAEGALAGLRTAVLVGEAVQPRKLMELPEPRPELVNLYGPTECSGIVTFHRMARDLSRYLTEPVPVGRPIPNGRIYLLDRAGSPVPIGVAGELHIGGTPVGRGYQNAAGQTAEKFVPDPFGEPGARLYRTGDRARWRADGTLEFLGRLDTQVKVRGYRIEPGEIEARLAAHEAVREAVVLVREDTEGEPRLVAYWLGQAVEAETLRAHLGEALPAYMVPAAYVRMEQWPLTPNGKLDRRALPAPEGDAYAARAYEAPADETEQALAQIWAEVLRVERVGRWDNFFELGGHSLSAVRVISRVRQELDVQIALGDLFTRPVLADLAQEILDAQLAQVDPEAMAELMALLHESAAP